MKCQNRCCTYVHTKYTKTNMCWGYNAQRNKMHSLDVSGGGVRQVLCEYVCEKGTWEGKDTNLNKHTSFAYMIFMLWVFCLIDLTNVFHSFH